MTKELVKVILQKADAFDWSIQGFGMLRLHLSDAVRLNVWDSRYRVSNVSLMHTHPWNFESLIVAGVLENQRYEEGLPDIAREYSYASIKPGPGGGLRENLGTAMLVPDNLEIYREGASYRQEYGEIHISRPADGTVTINQRQRVGEDVAFVYWPEGEEWVSAEPRRATAEEVKEITSNSLKEWFHG